MPQATITIPMHTYSGSWDSPVMTVPDTGQSVAVTLAPVGYTAERFFVLRWYKSDDGGNTWSELSHSQTPGSADGTGGISPTEPAFQRSLMPANPGSTYLVKLHLDFVGGPFSSPVTLTLN